MAIYARKEELALFLINKERERVGRDRQGGRRVGARGKIPSYNMEDWNGRRPAFNTSSTRIVEEFLTLDDLEVTDGDGKPLLWWCAARGLVSDRVATDVRLKSQYKQRWYGTLPLEKGERSLVVLQGLKLHDYFTGLNQNAVYQLSHERFTVCSAITCARFRSFSERCTAAHFSTHDL